MGITQKVLIGALSISLFSACEFSASPQASLADTPNSPTDSPPEIQKCSLEEETALESQMTRVLSEDTSPYAFSFRLERRDGRRFEFQKDGATFDTVFESASSSKLVTSLIILRLVDKGILKLSDRPQDHIPEWPITSSDPLYNATLANLLSFTSGFYDEPTCLNLPTGTLANCALTIATINSGKGRVPGKEFYYSGAHMQIAGLMAIRASGRADWTEVFDDFKLATGLFTASTYDLPSRSNPRLAGGMHWTGNEYFAFLLALKRDKLLSMGLRKEFFVDRTKDGDVAIVNSPAEKGLGEAWHYGLGFWHECLDTEFRCQAADRISSPGAYGAYPFWDRRTDHIGFLAMQGPLGGFREGARIERLVQDLSSEWATCGL